MRWEKALSLLLRSPPCMTAFHIYLLLQMIKDQMDKKFGAPWHVVVGKAFSYEVTTEVSRQEVEVARQVIYTDLSL